MKIAHELFDFKQLISALSTMYYSQCNQKGVVFETILTGITEESLIGDKLRLNQILLNLLSNAVKFTSKGGKITLGIAQQRIQSNRVYICFSVQDTGIGMDEEFRSRIFTPFEQESAVTAQRNGGSGLGLSIAKNLVDMMDGTIQVDSQKGVGTTFEVTIPFGYDDNHTHSQLNEQYDFSHVHVLIVDDEENVREYMGLLMQRCHVNFEVAKSGMEAVKKLSMAIAREEYFDLCLMDWKMPGLDGIETVKLIREISHGGLPIVIVTGYDFSEIESEARAAGVNHIVSKPLFQSSLFDILVSNYGGYTPKDTLDTFKHDFTGVQILVAEDNYVNMDIATRLLEKVHITVDKAADGKEALDKFITSAPGKYDVIFMDVQMPVMDGYTATKAIRASAHLEAKTIPVFAMTANAFQEDIAKSLEAGMNEHISKPMDADALFAVLEKYLRPKS